jgi:hypothetical protein
VVRDELATRQYALDAPVALTAASGFLWTSLLAGALLWRMRRHVR